MNLFIDISACCAASKDEETAKTQGTATQKVQQSSRGKEACPGNNKETKHSVIFSW